MGERTEHLLALVEETEFGIALPTTLRILRARCEASRDGSRRATWPPARSPWRRGSRKTCSGWPRPIRRLPPDDPAAPGHAAPHGPAGTRARAEPPDRRAQDGPDAPGRLNDDTVGVDKTRPAGIDLAARRPARGRDAGGHARRDPRLARQDRGAAADPRRQLPSESGDVVHRSPSTGRSRSKGWSVAAIRSVFSDPRLRGDDETRSSHARRRRPDVVPAPARLRGRAAGRGDHREDGRRDRRTQPEADRQAGPDRAEGDRQATWTS